MERAGDIVTAQALLHPLYLGSVKWAGPSPLCPGSHLLSFEFHRKSEAGVTMIPSPDVKIETQRLEDLSEGMQILRG